MVAEGSMQNETKNYEFRKQDLY